MNFYKAKEIAIKHITAVIATVLFAAFARPCAMTAYAEEMGHVVVAVIVQKNYTAPVEVTITPVIETGRVYKYTIDQYDKWVLNDHIPAGEYDVTAKLSEEGYKDEGYIDKATDFAVPYGTIIVSAQEKSYFTVMAGSREFTEKYWWLCKYVDNKGNHIRGEISYDQAEEYFNESLGVMAGPPEITAKSVMQMPDYNPGYDPDYDYGVMDEETINITETQVEFEAVVKEEPPKTAGFRPWFVLIPVFALAGTATAYRAGWIKRRVK